MNRVLTSSSLFAAILTLVPLTASAGDDDFAHHIGGIKYFTVIDSRDLDDKIADVGHMSEYEGPVVVALTQPSDHLDAGYLLQMKFSMDALGPMEAHPALELVDADALEGAPLLLTDQLSPAHFVETAEIGMDPTNLAAVIDLAWADSEIFDEMYSGFGEGDFLLVTQDPQPNVELPSDVIFGANVLDPVTVPSDMIAYFASANYSDERSHGVLVNPSNPQEMLRGFAGSADLIWIFNDPAQQDEQGGTGSGAGSDSGSDSGSGSGAGTDGSAGSDEEEQSGSGSEAIENNTWKVPAEAGEQMDLPTQTTSIKGKTGRTSYAPALDTKVYNR